MGIVKQALPLHVPPRVSRMKMGIIGVRFFEFDIYYLLDKLF
jgi:hypothetical protein